MSKLFRIAAVVAALFLVSGLTSAEEKKKAGAAAGKVKTIDTKENKITLEVKTKKDAPAEDQTFAIAKDAKVTINGEAKTLADVKAGDVVQVTLSEDKKTVTAINSGKKKKDK